MGDVEIEKALLQDLILDEGIKLKPYRCTAGKLTIGIGRNLDDVGITRAEAMQLCRNDIHNALDRCEEVFPRFYEYPTNRQRAIANMIFNLGTSRFLKFKNMIAAIRAEDWNRAALEAQNSAWYGQVGDRAKRVIRLLKDE